MRFAIFGALTVCGLGGCDVVPYMDLQESIYMVADPSFWDGCADDAAGYEACRAFRVSQVNAGVDWWFGHFDQATRPEVLIVYSEKELPENRVNEIVYLKIGADECSGGYSCYHGTYGSAPKLAFNDPKYITPFLVAHEFGHILGRDDNDTPADVYSIMSYERPSYVLPVDIDMVCDIHTECPPHENRWCEGGFYDPCRCPSASFAQGTAKKKAGEITCNDDEDKIWW